MHYSFTAIDDLSNMRLNCNRGLIGYNHTILIDLINLKRRYAA